MTFQKTQQNIVFAFKHPIRRSIIEILNHNSTLNPNEISNILNIIPNRYFYHLDNLTNQIEQDNKQRCNFNQKGIVAYNLLLKNSNQVS